MIVLPKQLVKAKEINVALIGNPNTGKSTIFNNLTGEKQIIGNWPGVTVEKKEGYFTKGPYRVKVVDLPGTYNLTALSIDEKIARSYILEHDPDVVVQIMDASKLERNLYLLLELLELGANVVVALNMYDQLEPRGIKININKLEEFFGVKLVPTIGPEKIGMEELKTAILEAAEKKKKSHFKLDYGELVEKAISRLEDVLKANGVSEKTRWIAIKLLENDPDIIDYVKSLEGADAVFEVLSQVNREILEKEGKPVAMIILGKRYDLIKKIVNEAVEVEEKIELTVTDLVDGVVTHPIWGLPIFIIVIYSMFKFTFDVAQPFVDLIDLTITYLGEITANAVTNPVLSSFLVDGIIGGIGNLLVFVPNIFFLFLFMSFLEDLGYMSRVAYNFDNLMRKLGLSGKSIIPLLLSMGCNVPAIMSTRTIDDPDDRMITIMVSPLIPCSARFPVFIMLASIFFANYAAIAVLSMYLLGFTLAVLIAMFLRKFIYRSSEASFIIELPNYKKPTTEIILKQTWQRGKHFLEKVGGVILILSIIVWVLLYLPYGAPIDQTYGAMLGKTLEPILSPLGFTWQIALALIFGFIAKEVIISSLAIIFSGQDLAVALTGLLNPVTAYALMAFVLIYTPCIPTLAAIRSETGKTRTVIYVVLYELLLAYFVALGITVIGNLLLGV